jgi:hypothetical protein
MQTCNFLRKASFEFLSITLFLIRFQLFKGIYLLAVPVYLYPEEETAAAGVLVAVLVGTLVFCLVPFINFQNYKISLTF